MSTSEASEGPELGPDAEAKLRTVLDALVADPRSLSSVSADQAWRAHVADSLTGLLVPEVRAAGVIADVGSGAGVPGFVLAVAVPEARVYLVESLSRKCDFMREAATEAGIGNVEVVCGRSEEWAAHAPPEGGRELADVVTARAVARLATLTELASPLLRAGGVLVAWKGKRDADEEAELERALQATAMGSEGVHGVGEKAGYEHRHLYVLRKTDETPANLPRRPGLAKKRPLQ